MTEGKWALHVVGPDDIVAFPSRKMAEDAVELLEGHRNDNPPYWGEAVPWPNQEGHQDDLDRLSWMEFLPRLETGGSQ